MKKLVNGIEVEMTAEEIAQREQFELVWNNKDWRPIATGKGLIAFLEKQNRRQSKTQKLKFDEKAVKRSKFQNIFTKWKFSSTETGDLWAQIESEEEFTQEEFDYLLNTFETTKALNNGMAYKTEAINNMIALINEWKDTVRFV